jgi:plasmid maintenance system killer protein
MPIEIIFRTERLRRDCTEDRWMRRAWGANRTRVLRRRLDQIHAAETLADLRPVHPRTHELIGDHAGQISLDLDGPWRVLLEPVDPEAVRKPDGGLDWTRITAVRILAVEDTHA